MRALALVACVALVAPAHAEDVSTGWPEPARCYLAAGTDDPGMTVGLAVDLCANSSDAKATLKCYTIAFTQLELNRGQAVRLCSAKPREPLQ
jgi:hypothetical protein